MADLTAESTKQHEISRSSEPPSSTVLLPRAPSKEEIEAALPPYIAQQRWFGGKSRRIAYARFASTSALPGSEAVLTTVAVHYDDGGPGDLYQLPLASASAAEAQRLQRDAPKSVVLVSNNGEASTVVYDATADASVRSALLRLIAESGRGQPANTSAASSHTPFAAERSAALDGSKLLQASSRVGSVEQSNTSIIYGDQAILKLFRRLRPGENPDVEIARFLTETAHFANIPAYFGDLHLASDRTTLAFLQQFAVNQGDGWAWTLEELARFYASVAGSAPPETASTLPCFSASTQTADALREPAGTYLEAAALLGRRTGEMHMALATPTANAAFAAEPYTASDLDADRLRIGSQADAALSTLAEKLSDGALEDRAASLARDLLARRDSIRSRATDLAGNPSLFGKRIRIHGDFHLGQLLRADQDFLIVDFEGEPAKTLEERRRKLSPLKDVAGMLRSFSYAARSALEQHATETPDQRSKLQSWATHWENAVCAEYLRGYREATANGHSLLPEPVEADALLSALLLEKALYELLYELNNRPMWLHIPLAGLLALAT